MQSDAAFFQFSGSFESFAVIGYFGVAGRDDGFRQLTVARLQIHFPAPNRIGKIITDPILLSAGTTSAGQTFVFSALLYGVLELSPIEVVSVKAGTMVR